MKTININGKEYSKDDFFETISIGSYYDAYGCDLVDDIIEDFWDSQNKDFPRHEPEPPKLRPMSELPEARERYLFKRVSRASEEKYISGVLFSSSTGFYVVTDDEKFYFSKDDFRQKASSMQIIGWLPLPNDIKL